MNNTFSYRFALISCVLILTGIGLLAIYASSGVSSHQIFGSEFVFFRKQALVSAIGFLLIFVISYIPIRIIEKLTLPLLLIAIVLLILTHVPMFAKKAGHAARWIKLGVISFQPAELAKLALILFLAKNLSRPSINMDNFLSGIMSNVVVFFIIAVLLMLQPDFGTTFLLFALTFLMLFVAGLNWRYIVVFALLGLISSIVAIIFAPYRLARLVNFLNPWQNFKEGGFQLIQSYLGFQNGGLLGVGIGGSKQKLYFLPEAHTDFILSVIGEELGFLGVGLICFTFIYLMFLGFKITLCQQNYFNKFLAFGITMLISLQALINMGVTLGLLPTKGIPLPFVSYGSSSLLIFLISIGILARLAQEIDTHHV